MQVGACNGGDGIGKNTCYMRKEWNWVSHLTDNKWTFQFEAPGQYEFRVSYCGCNACQPGISSFAHCSDYEQEGASSTVTMDPPFDLSPYSPGEQVAMGVLWNAFEGSMILMEKVLANAVTGGSDEQCASCFCEAKTIATDFADLVTKFKILCQGFSFTSLQLVMGDLQGVVENIQPALRDCKVNEIAGKDITGELMLAAGEWLTGLAPVVEAVKVAVATENIYCDLSNTMLAWDQHNYFATGMNLGRLSAAVLSTIQGNLLAARVASTSIRSVRNGASDGALSFTEDDCVLRHPGGVWSKCNCSAPLDLRRYPGNECRRLGSFSYRVTPAPSYTKAPSSSYVLSGPELIGVCVASAAATLTIVFASLYVIRKRRRARYQQQVSGAQSDLQVGLLDQLSGDAAL